MHATRVPPIKRASTRAPPPALASTRPRPPASPLFFRVHDATASRAEAAVALPLLLARDRSTAAPCLPRHPLAVQPCIASNLSTTAAQSCLPDHEQNATTTAERPVVLDPCSIQTSAPRHRRPGLFVGHEQTNAASFWLRFPPPRCVPGASKV